MMDVITGAFGGLKAAAELTQGLLTLKTDAAISAKVIELNGVISSVQQQLFSAQTDYAAVLSRIRDLEAEIAQFKNWEQEKERYELYELTIGTLVYRIKPSMQGSEPIHHICPNCYEQGIKSILQYSAIKSLHASYSCPRCKASFLGSKVDMGGFIEITRQRGF